MTIQRAWLGMPLAVLATVLLCLSALSAAGVAERQSLVWGPYRPNLYFGVRPRLPGSLATGLIWSRVDDPSYLASGFRYTCEQGDNMEGYGWEEYDARNGGRQVMHDSANLIDLTTDFVKVPGGENGGSWGVRVTGKLRKDAPADHKTTIVFAATMEGRGSLKLANEFDVKGIEGDVRFVGDTPQLGNFTLDITRGPDTNAHPEVRHESSLTKPLDRTMVSSVNVKLDQLWQTKAIFFELMKSVVDAIEDKWGIENMPPAWQVFTIPNTGEGRPGNTNFVQKVFEGSFEFDILFSSSSSGPDPMTSEKLTLAIQKTSEDFEKNYTKNAKPSAPFDKAEYEPFLKSLLSNLMGGLGYFFGDSLVDKSYAPEYEEADEGFWAGTAEAKNRSKPAKHGPQELFTAVPSRPFFPRGFLWDEGFHLLPIIDWDTDVVFEVLESWVNLMDENGWIAREQILGQEARSKVPPEFQVQYPHYANPPTFFLVIEEFLDKMISKELSSEQALNFASTMLSLYPLLKRHYFWYRKTQKGELKAYDRKPFSPTEAYRWRGRTETHLLTSGFDDYPRAQPPHPAELHVDLISWMGLMSRVMKRVADLTGEEADAVEYGEYEAAIARNIDDLHWSKKDKAFCDASIDDFGESAHVCHKGYVSLLPFVTGMLGNDSPRLKAVLDLISDPDELWTPYGLRSLSASDENYGTGENYWRGPIWINMNYLALSSLLRVGQDKDSPYRERAAGLYKELRRNLVETVYKSWKETGFAWEQYNPDTGAGQRIQYFTGWTSLVAKIMRMPDVPDVSKGTKPKPSDAATPEHEEL